MSPSCLLLPLPLTHPPPTLSCTVCVCALQFVEEEGVVAIAAALPRSRLATLNLSEINRNHDHGMSGFVAIARALKASDRLTCLNLSSNDIDVPACKALADALAANRVLARLDLSSNRLCGTTGGMRRTGTYDASAIRALAHALLQDESALTDLNLRCNELGDEGGRAMAELLEANARLTKCDLSSNGFGDEGKQAVRGVCKARAVGCELQV